MARTGYDCIVIGGGHNGLIAAAYLARAGRKVCVLERREVIGGCSATEELWPGYRVSTAAYVLSLLLPEIIRELDLQRHGLRILPRNPSSFTPTLEGRSLMLGPDREFNQRQIAPFSERDAAAYPKYEKMLERVATHLESLLSEPAPDILPLPDSWRKRSVKDRLRSARDALRLRSRLGELGDALPEAIELVAGAARPILERWFESDVLRATLATDAVIGAFASPSSPGTAYVLMHHVMGTAGGARGVWGYVQGGMGQLAEAVWAYCRTRGVELKRNSAVASIDVAHGRVVGVTTVDGESLQARCVLSSIDAHQTFRRLLSPEVLPEPFLAAVDRIDYSSASMKINLALGELPDFRACPGTDVGPQHRGTIHICDSLDWLERAFDDAKLGRPSDRPLLEVTIPTSVDATIAPPGKHLMNIFVQYAPYRLSGGKSWDEMKEVFADKCIDLLIEFAPNMRHAIEHRHVLSPLDLERELGLTGGNIFQGAMHLHQLMSMRPVPGWADYRTPVPGLYLCGAATHPGGGVMGACGRNAAAAVLADR
ncbi:MAG: NAD(P)/FAD-dependent oxidoreductase [Planctomycetota bacterium]|nr:MAG: NAD(P)/FAD-dependent oxidoreductase [Planctomycetota bacterium]